MLEGEHVFRVGEEEFHGDPGTIVFAPRKVPHAHRRVMAREGRFLTMLSPGAFEGFFRQLADAERRGTLGPDAYADASGKYEITWLD